MTNAEFDVSRSTFPCNSYRFRSVAYPTATTCPDSPAQRERRSFPARPESSPQPFDPDVLTEQFRSLHTEIEKVFHWAVTDAGKARFGYEAIDEETA